MISVKNLLNFFLITLLLVSCNESSSSKGDVYYSEGQYEEAIMAYASYLENRPNNVKALYNKGRAHEELNELKKAEDSFKLALKQDPKNIQVLLSLSNLYHKNEQPELALMYADNAVEVAGAPAMAYFLKARSMHRLGNVKEALREYNTAIKMSPKNGQTYYYRGMLYVATEEASKACSDFRTAAENGYDPADEAIKNYCP
ncbi:tetratricopeptide repeat protein [Cyclobacterium sp.]|uniref:tetratricopeptide repeat protein n=1 Tax=Cyclobacterium sp. TaxID=1966343 RepID=UPI00199F1E44|nr:tetratricopeptide repeat protein [Cyclobacterium sp.]MBD3627052.1 tetratricopeptide repeat protein [Cyclobacterium sp.]